MEIQNSRQKIFITAIDSKLGYHLVQQLRDDHIKLQNYSYIVGNKSKSNRKQLHQSVHGVVNLDKQPTLFAKAVLQSDIVVIDGRQASNESEFIMKLIEQRAKDAEKGKCSIKNMRIVCIGSHMSWAHQKSNTPHSFASHIHITPSKHEFPQKEHSINKILSFEPQKQQSVTQNDRNKRFAHHNWIRERELEKRVINLNKYKHIRSYILTTGLIYGKDFPSVELEDLFIRCFTVSEDVYIYGQGNNILPLTYIDDLCQSVQVTLKNMEQNSDKYLKNLIIVDENSSTQIEIVQKLLKHSGFIKIPIKLPITCLTKQQAILSQTIPLKKSPQFNCISSQKSLGQYLQFKFDQILTYIDVEINHYILYSQQMQPTQVQQLDKKLSSVIQVFREQDLCTQICHKKNIPKQQMDIHELSAAIEELYLNPHDGENYVLILSKNLLNTDVVKKYNMKKFVIEEDGKKLLGHLSKEENKQILEQKQVEEQKEIHINIQDSIDKQQNKQNICTKAQSLEQKQRQQKIRKAHEKKVTKQRSKVDQYLYDNVICYVAQAFLQINKNPTLPALIQSLKQIYNRQLLYQNNGVVQIQNQ